MSLIIEEQNWMCLRCFRVNSSYNSDQHCDYGCGYTVDTRIFSMYEWKCPKCYTNNVKEMFTRYECKECRYIIRNAEINKNK